MGITKTSELWFKKNGALFKGKKIVTLGRLYPYFSTKHRRDWLARYEHIGDMNNQYAKILFEDELAVRTLSELDISDYQGANLIQNLSRSLNENYKGQFDIVLDAGTIEHVSDMKMFLINIFDLLKEDGHFIFGTVTNNWIDHGFWQFSPTFFIDFCEANNLELKEINLNINGKFYDLTTKPFFIKSILYNQSGKVSVCGIIRKTHARDLSFDFIQSKYKRLHHLKAEQDKQWVMFLILRSKSLINWLFHLKFIPLSLRLALAELALAISKK